MIITWYGQACFKVQSGDKALILDPFDKSIGLTPPSGQADMVLVTHQHKDHNNIASLKGDFFLADSPGEYEVKGVKITGIQSFHDNEQGKKRGVNTMYLVEAEGITILHMGDFGQDELEDNQLELIGSVNILMIPVGGFFTIDAKTAVSIINQIEPSIVIPMHYKVPKLTIPELEDLKKFSEEFGGDGAESQDKLTIKQKDFAEEEEKTRVVVLKI